MATKNLIRNLCWMCWFFIFILFKLLVVCHIKNNWKSTNMLIRCFLLICSFDLSFPILEKDNLIEHLYIVLSWVLFLNPVCFDLLKNASSLTCFRSLEMLTINYEIARGCYTLFYFSDVLSITTCLLTVRWCSTPRTPAVKSRSVHPPSPSPSTPSSIPLSLAAPSIQFLYQGTPCRASPQDCRQLEHP